MADERYNLGKTVKNYDYKKYQNYADFENYGFEKSEYTTKTDVDSNIILPDDVSKLKELSDIPYARFVFP